MRTALTLALTVSALGTAPALAQQWYGQVNLGVTLGGATEVEGTVNGVGPDTLEPDMETDGIASALIGRPLRGPLGVEAEVVVLDVDARPEDLAPSFGIESTGGHSAVGAMFNLTYEMDTGTAWTPYGAVGIGYGKSKYSLDGESDSDRGLMAQVKLGLNYNVNDVLSFDLGYRAIKTPEAEIKDATSNYKATSLVHAVTVGARYQLQSQ